MIKKGVSSKNEGVIGIKLGLVMSDEIRRLVDCLFNWEGPEEGVSLECALRETLSRFDRLSTTGNNELLSYCKEVIREAKSIYNLRFENAEYRPTYHDVRHTQWTIIHALRAYIGAIKKDEVSFRLKDLKLLVAASAFHEVDDWWNGKTPVELEKKIKGELADFLSKEEISLIDFSRVLRLGEFSMTSEKAVSYYLLGKGEDIKYKSRILYLSDDSAKQLFFDDLSDSKTRERFLMLKLMGEILRGADFAQCVDSAYLKRVKVKYIGKDGSHELISLPAGAIPLAVEFFHLRPRALKLFRWGSEEMIDWPMIGTNRYFYKKHFTPNFGLILSRLDAYYDGPGNNPYREKQKELREVIEETEKRIGKEKRRRLEREEGGW